MQPILITIAAAVITTFGVAVKPDTEPAPEPVQQVQVVEEEAEAEVQEEPQEIVKPTVTWKDNPNGCDTDKQWIAAEEPFECIDKPVQRQTPKAAPAPASLGWCNADHLGGRAWNVNTAIAICKCESGGNANALNSTPPDYSVGLFQINLYGSLAKNRPSEAWLRDPHNNVNYAYQMWQSSGWTPWTCRHKI